MDSIRNCVNARAFPVSDALCCLNAVRSRQEPLYLRGGPDIVKNMQGSPRAFPASDALYQRVSQDIVRNLQGLPRKRRTKHAKENAKANQRKRLRLGSWNIGTLTGKSMEVVDTMIRRKINIMCLQETK